MIRPGLAFALWLAIALLVVVNDTLGDTIIAERLPVMAVEWYKALVPLPYVVLMAVIYARRTQGPQWFEAAMLAAMLWPTTRCWPTISTSVSPSARKPSPSSIASPSGGARPIRCW